MNAVEFRDVTYTLVAVARDFGLAAPIVFKSVPAGDGRPDRIARRRESGYVLAVRIAGRDRDAVIDDLIAGILHVNGQTGPDEHPFTAAARVAFHT